MKEYLSRGTYIFPPEPSRRLIVDMFAFCNQNVPLWNPMNVCSYHLQEAGATPTQEIAYSLASAIGVLDAVRDSGQVAGGRMSAVVASVSLLRERRHPLRRGDRKMRAFTRMWDRITRERYGVTDPKARRFRYGVQVNSLGLTEAQPENNVQRIVLEALGVTLSKSCPRPLDAAAGVERGARPAPPVGPAVVAAHPAGARVRDRPARVRRHLRGLPRDQEPKTAELVDVRPGRARRDPRARRRVRGDRRDEGPARAQPHRAHAPHRVGRADGHRRQRVHRDRRVAARRRGQHPEGRPRRAGRDDRRRARSGAPPATRRAVDAALDELERVARTDENIMPATIALAQAGGTTGEWAGRLREVFGEYRAPTGRGRRGGRRAARSDRPARAGRAAARHARVGRRGCSSAKPGLDGHSNGAEQIAVAARDAGMEVIYQGIRLTPEQIAAAARDEDVDVVGLSILSGSHLELIPEVVRLLRAEGVDRPVVAGGIIPEDDRAELLDAGVAAVFTPKDFELTRHHDRRSPTWPWPLALRTRDTAAAGDDTGRVVDIDELVLSCCGALAEPEPRAAIREVVERAVSEPNELLGALPADSGGLNMLHRSDDLTILQIVWAPGMRLFPHDHNMWACIGIYAGSEDNEFFRRAPDGQTGLEARRGPSTRDRCHHAARPRRHPCGGQPLLAVSHGGHPRVRG